MHFHEHQSACRCCITCVLPVFALQYLWQFLRRSPAIPNLDQRTCQDAHHILQKSIAPLIDPEIIPFLRKIDLINRADRRFFHFLISAK